MFKIPSSDDIVRLLLNLQFLPNHKIATYMHSRTVERKQITHVLDRISNDASLFLKHR